MKIEDQITTIVKGKDAQALKKNPALVECMDTTMGELFARWCATGPKDAEERMAIWSTAQALKEFKDTIDAFINNGKYEELNSDQNNDK